MNLAEALAFPVIDREQLDMLVEAGGEAAADLIQELLDLFKGESEPKLETLQGLLAAQDRAQLAKTAHALAGSCSNLGAMRLSKLCKVLELNAAHYDFADLEQAHGAVLAEYPNTLETFDRELQRLRG